MSKRNTIHRFVVAYKNKGEKYIYICWCIQKIRYGVVPSTWIMGRWCPIYDSLIWHQTEFSRKFQGNNKHGMILSKGQMLRCLSIQPLWISHSIHEPYWIYYKNFIKDRSQIYLEDTKGIIILIISLNTTPHIQWLAVLYNFSEN